MMGYVGGKPMGVVYPGEKGTLDARNPSNNPYVELHAAQIAEATKMTHAPSPYTPGRFRSHRPLYAMKDGHATLEMLSKYARKQLAITYDGLIKRSRKLTDVSPAGTKFAAYLSLSPRSTCTTIVPVSRRRPRRSSQGTVHEFSQG